MQPALLERGPVIQRRHERSEHPIIREGRAYLSAERLTLPRQRRGRAHAHPDYFTIIDTCVIFSTTGDSHENLMSFPTLSSTGLVNPRDLRDFQ